MDGYQKIEQKLNLLWKSIKDEPSYENLEQMTTFIVANKNQLSIKNMKIQAKSKGYDIRQLTKFNKVMLLKILFCKE